MDFLSDLLEKDPDKVGAKKPYVLHFTGENIVLGFETVEERGKFLESVNQQYPSLKYDLKDYRGVK